MTVTPQGMRDTLRLWASGVAVVTTHHDDQRVGMTVSAFNSLSLEPPLVVVCLYKDTVTARTVCESGVFAISVLAAESTYLSDRFAGRIKLAEGEDRFDGVALSDAGVTGSPVLADSLAWLDCRVHTVHEGGTHWIVIGEVLATGQHHTPNGGPLIYFDRDYRELQQQVIPS